MLYSLRIYVIAGPLNFLFPLELLTIGHLTESNNINQYRQADFQKTLKTCFALHHII